MKKIFFLLILGLLIASISACESSETSSEPWIPVLEDTSFSYLKDSACEAVKDLAKASNKIQTGEKAESSKALQRAMNSLLELRFYYIPMTEVRQLVYDADRLLFLKKVDKTQEKLKQANKLLTDIANSDGPNLEEPVNKLVLMIDELILSIQESSSTVPKKLRDVGHRVNLMALKGELILTDAKFDPNR
ncbi:MAG: hypothetical protein BA872_05040 [Desulfobacterales bacterium C00003060]|nr:MAG: hypothetical protein BA861_11285 [Desulfobacterales bacterium S3730MH5]OEU80412.1 MAG: hypothetical protein BA872_05040 [Desulfobacterales bacterium C00003060]